MNPSLPPVLALIGNTPLLRLHFRPENIVLFAKAEFLNPSGSTKDRIACHWSSFKVVDVN